MIFEKINFEILNFIQRGSITSTFDVLKYFCATMQFLSGVKKNIDQFDTSILVLKQWYR